jgi:hypothetical protein
MREEGLKNWEILFDFRDGATMSLLWALISLRALNHPVFEILTPSLLFSYPSKITKSNFGRLFMS